MEIILTLFTPIRNNGNNTIDINDSDNSDSIIFIIDNGDRGDITIFDNSACIIAIIENGYKSVVITLIIDNGEIITPVSVVLLFFRYR